MQFHLPAPGFALIAALLAVTQCHPLRSHSRDPIHARSAFVLTAKLILTVAPTSSTCDGEPYPEQCRTAAQAVGPIITSLNSYGTTSVGETAAMIATMAFESGDFKYNVNISPGRPGQGTRNMQMPDFNVKYAASIPALATPLAAVSNDPDRVRALLTANDEYDFGSAAWYLKTQCGPDVRENLASGGIDGFKVYVTGCLRATITAERLAYYERAIMALNPHVKRRV